MGIYSTIYVTRSKAIETVTAMLERELERLQRGNLSDEELETYLDNHLKAQLNNAIVVNDMDDNQDDEVPSP